MAKYMSLVTFSVMHDSMAALDAMHDGLTAAGAMHIHIGIQAAPPEEPTKETKEESPPAFVDEYIPNFKRHCFPNPYQEGSKCWDQHEILLNFLEVKHQELMSSNDNFAEVGWTSGDIIAYFDTFHTLRGSPKTAYKVMRRVLEQWDYQLLQATLQRVNGEWTMGKYY